jgi:predicted RecA/RadA family phage recombinase
MAQNLANSQGLPIPLPIVLGGTRAISTTSNRIIYGSPSAPGYISLNTQTSGFMASASSGAPIYVSAGSANRLIISSAGGTPTTSGTNTIYPVNSGWTTYTPTITVSGGTVPTYTAINSGRWQQVGNVIHVRIVLTNSSGGTAGAGTNAIVVTLPTARGTSGSSVAIQQVGYALNNATYYLLRGSFSASSSSLALLYYNALTTTTNLTGALQNNAIRELHLSFCYEK